MTSSVWMKWFRRPRIYKWNDISAKHRQIQWILRGIGYLTSTSFCLLSQTSPILVHIELINSTSKDRKRNVIIDFPFKFHLQSALLILNVVISSRVANCSFFCAVSTIQEFISCEMAGSYKKWIPFNYGRFLNLWTMPTILCSRHSVFINDETNLIISYWNSAESRLVPIELYNDLLNLFNLIFSMWNFWSLCMFLRFIPD